jgi:hypothetical protein
MNSRRAARLIGVYHGDTNSLFFAGTFSLTATLHVTKAVCHRDAAAGFGANGACEIAVIAVKDNSANQR